MKRFKQILSVVCISSMMLFALSGCGNVQTPSSESNEVKQEDISTNNTNDISADNIDNTAHSEEQGVVALQGTPIVTMNIKDYGQITLELYPEMAPNTVNNFVTLANDGFYDGLIFHRVISGFMIQGGDPQGVGIGGPGYSIQGEFADNGFTQNTLSHTKGVISMARSYDPDSAGSQFFIMSEDGTYLDGQYAAFGKVTEGLDVVEAIQNVATNSNDKPLEDVIIESVNVDVQEQEVPAVIKINE